jgi:hypothetical protein
MLLGVHTRNIAKRTAAKMSSMGRCGRQGVEAWLFPMKSHTPECAKIEQFAATLVPVEIFLMRWQQRGFGTPDCAPIFVTKRDDRSAIRVNCH